jgi:DNA-binding NtrC family response regulator
MPRFLLVDDDDSTVHALTRLLEEDGHEVVPVASHEAALEALAREPFDAVVADLDKRVDGHAILHAARKHRPSACRVAVTARPHEYIESLGDDGACIVADKPLAYDEMATAIGECRARGGRGAHGKCQACGEHRGPVMSRLRRR